MFMLLDKLGITSRHLSFIGGNPCKLEHLSTQLAKSLALKDSVDGFDLSSLEHKEGQKLREQLTKVVLAIFQKEVSICIIIYLFIQLLVHFFIFLSARHCTVALEDGSQSTSRCCRQSISEWSNPYNRSKCCWTR
jgi:hypothetical protein